MCVCVCVCLYTYKINENVTSEQCTKTTANSNYIVLFYTWFWIELYAGSKSSVYKCFFMELYVGGDAAE